MPASAETIQKSTGMNGKGRGVEALNASTFAPAFPEVSKSSPIITPFKDLVYLGFLKNFGDRRGAEDPVLGKGVTEYDLPGGTFTVFNNEQLYLSRQVGPDKYQLHSLTDAIAVRYEGSKNDEVDIILPLKSVTIGQGKESKTTKTATVITIEKGSTKSEGVSLDVREVDASSVSEADKGIVELARGLGVVSYKEARADETGRHGSTYEELVPEDFVRSADRGSVLLGRAVDELVNTTSADVYETMSEKLDSVKKPKKFGNEKAVEPGDAIHERRSFKEAMDTPIAYTEFFKKIGAEISSDIELFDPEHGRTTTTVTFPANNYLANEVPTGVQSVNGLAIGEATRPRIVVVSDTLTGVDAYIQLKEEKISITNADILPIGSGVQFFIPGKDGEDGEVTEVRTVTIGTETHDWVADGKSGTMYKSFVKDTTAKVPATV